MCSCALGGREGGREGGCVCASFLSCLPPAPPRLPTPSQPNPTQPNLSQQHTPQPQPTPCTSSTPSPVPSSWPPPPPECRAPSFPSISRIRGGRGEERSGVDLMLLLLLVALLRSALLCSCWCAAVQRRLTTALPCSALPSSQMQSEGWRRFSEPRGRV
jgi:hypothetical protein